MEPTAKTYADNYNGGTFSSAGLITAGKNLVVFIQKKITEIKNTVFSPALESQKSDNFDAYYANNSARFSLKTTLQTIQRSITKTVATIAPPLLVAIRNIFSEAMKLISVIRTFVTDQALGFKAWLGRSEIKSLNWNPKSKKTNKTVLHASGWIFRVGDQSVAIGFLTPKGKKVMNKPDFNGYREHEELQTMEKRFSYATKFLNIYLSYTKYTQSQIQK